MFNIRISFSLVFKNAPTGIVDSLDWVSRVVNYEDKTIEEANAVLCRASFEDLFESVVNISVKADCDLTANVRK